MKSIYNLIKEEVREHSIVKNSILAYSNPWKRSHYVILAEVIKAELAKKEENENDANIKCLKKANQNSTITNPLGA